ncbi:MAG: hypothetical protein PF503_06230 [Desulfobacula sp.]|jgi:hypothetical protein|nr:hypothetical protein [Desulfobacula sp.]
MRGLVTEGTVTAFSGATGLLQTLLDWLAGSAASVGWSVKYKRNTRDSNRSAWTEPFGSTCQECILHNTGISGLENVLVGIREWKYPAGGAHAWDLTGYTTYVADQYWNVSADQHGRDAYDATWEHFTQLPMLPLTDDTMYYWFYADPQRIVVCVKVQSNYESCYLGFGDRFGNPADYPYPLLIKGSAWGNLPFSSTSGYHHSIVDDSDSSFSNGNNKLVVRPDNSWCNIDHYTDCKIHPKRDWHASGIITETPSHKEVLVSPVTAIDQETKAVLFEMDQVIHIAGVGVQAEDLIDGPSKLRYKIFQNVFRNDYDDFFGVATSDYTTTTTTTTTV